jgi:hypothetical protein
VFKANSFKVFHFQIKGFQRKILKCEKLANDRRRAPSDGKSSNCFLQGEQAKRRYIMQRFCNNCHQGRPQSINLKVKYFKTVGFKHQSIKRSKLILSEINLLTTFL